MARTHVNLVKGIAALALSSVLFTAGCASDQGSNGEPTGNGASVTDVQEPQEETNLVANGSVFGEREILPPAVEGEFGYLTMRDVGEARHQAALAGEEDPGPTPGIQVLIRHGEPIPDNVKEEIEERFIHQSARMFATMPDLPEGAESHLSFYAFFSRTGGRLDELSELSGTYVDIIVPRGMISEKDYLDFNHYIAVRAWNSSGFVGFTDTLEEYLANYEAYLAEEGITDYELWVMEPEVKAPWMQ